MDALVVEPVSNLCVAVQNWTVSVGGATGLPEPVNKKEERSNKKKEKVWKMQNDAGETYNAVVPI